MGRKQIHQSNTAMWGKILITTGAIFAIISLSSCGKKNEIEHRIDGLWEVCLPSQSDYEYWYDSCRFIGQIIFFDMAKHECYLPGVEETMEERAKANYKGSWSISKADSRWTMTINPRKHPIQGLFYISFYKDTVCNSFNHEEIHYFLNIKNEEWDIVCKKSGMLTNTW